MTFKRWCLTQTRNRQKDGIRDLAWDVTVDRNWPRGQRTLREYHDYLDSCYAVEEAHQALDRAWDEWARS